MQPLAKLISVHGSSKTGLSKLQWMHTRHATSDWTKLLTIVGEASGTVTTWNSRQQKMNMPLNQGIFILCLDS